MAFRLGHQITCNINKNLFFRNSSANARRYRSLSRGNEGRVENEQDVLPAAQTNPFRSTRARSQPRCSIPSNLTRREYSSQSSPKQQQQQHQPSPPQSEKNVMPLKNNFKKSSASYSLQPKNLPPMATTHIHLTNNFAPTEETQDVRPYENRLDEVQKQASAKYEKAVKTFNVNSRLSGSSGGGGGYRYELDAAKPKLDKGTNVYNVVAAIKSREQSIAAQAPQLQPKNIRPYGDIMSKQWCSPLMERIKHKPLSIARLEEAIQRTIVKKQPPISKPSLDSNKPQGGPTLTSHETNEGQQPSGQQYPTQELSPQQSQQQRDQQPRDQQIPHYSQQQQQIIDVVPTKPVDQIIRRSFSTMSAPRMSISSTTTALENPTKQVKEYQRKNGELEAEKTKVQQILDKDVKCAQAADQSVHDLVPKINEITSGVAEEKYALRNQQQEQLKAKQIFGNSLQCYQLGSKENLFSPMNENRAMTNMYSARQHRYVKPIKVKLGPKLKLQSWNLQEIAVDEASLIPETGEKFVVPWISWGDRVKMKQQQHEPFEGARPKLLSSVTPLMRTADKKRCTVSDIQVRRYFTGKSLDDINGKEAELERKLTPSLHKDFVAGIDWPENIFSNYRGNNKIYRRNTRSYSTGIPDECICDRPPTEKTESKGYDPMCDPIRYPHTHVNPDCTKRCVLGPEYTVMVKLRRLPKIKLPDPIRYCPEPCDDAIRADDGLPMPERRALPRLEVKQCPPVAKPCMTDVPLVRLKKRATPTFVRVCPQPPCREERADDGLQVCPKKLPKLVPKMCGRCEEIVMTTPPLYRLTPKQLPPPKPCKPILCVDPPNTRADDGMRVPRKKLRPLTPPCCPRVCDDSMVDGPPLKRLKCYCVSEPERVCPCVPTARDPCCPPRADEICNYTVERKELPTMILSARNNQISTVEYARRKREKERHMRHFSTYTKHDMCCYSNKKVKPDLEAIQKDIRSTEWEGFTGYLAAGKDGTVEVYDTSCEVVDTSTGAEIRIIKKPIGRQLMRRDDNVQNRLLQGGYSAKFSERSFSTVSSFQRKVDYNMPLARNIKTKSEAEPRVCADESRADDTAAEKSRKRLPPVPMSTCPPTKKCKLKPGQPLPRLNFKNLEVDPPREQTDFSVPSIGCVRADEGKDLVSRKSLPILSPTSCPFPDPVKLKDCEPLKRLPPHPPTPRTPNASVSSAWNQVHFPSVPLTRKFSTLSRCFIYNENFTEFYRSCRHVSRSSIFQAEKDCKIKKEEKKKECPKFAMPTCKPRYTEPPTCDRTQAYPECTKQPSPYPSFSECKDDDPYIGLTECPPNNKYLQPRFPLIGEFVILKPPPPIQKKIDPKLEEDCIIKKLNLKRENIGTKTCTDFHRPYIPLRAKDLMQSAMKQAEVLPAEEECKPGKRKAAKDCPEVQDNTCAPGDIQCQLIGKPIDSMLCSEQGKKNLVSPKKGEPQPGDIVCKGVIKDCSPRIQGKERPKKAPCKPYIPKPSPPRKLTCKRPMICEEAPEQKKKEGGKKAAITSKINRPIKGGNGGTNSSGGGQIRNVGGGGGNSDPCSSGKQGKGAKESGAKDRCADVCKPKKEAKAKEAKSDGDICDEKPEREAKKAKSECNGKEEKAERKAKKAKSDCNGKEEKPESKAKKAKSVCKGKEEKSESRAKKAKSVCKGKEEKPESRAKKDKAVCKGKEEKPESKGKGVCEAVCKGKEKKPDSRAKKDKAVCKGKEKKPESRAKEDKAICKKPESSAKAKSKAECKKAKPCEKKGDDKAKKRKPCVKSGKEKKSIAVKCKPPGSLAKSKKSIAIKCSPLKKPAVRPPPKCSVQPAPVISSVCPKKSLWDRILDFFRARPNCPAPDQWKKDKLKRAAEKAAAAAGYDLCEKKKKPFVCAIRGALKEAKKKPCPFPAPPLPQTTAKGKSAEGKECGMKVKPCRPVRDCQSASDDKCKPQPKFKCKPKAKKPPKPPPPKSGGTGSKCTFGGNSGNGPSSRKSSSGSNKENAPPKKVACSSSQMNISSNELPVLVTSYSCRETFPKIPIPPTYLDRSGIFTKGKSDIHFLPKQTRPFSTAEVRNYSRPDDPECKNRFVPPKSACRLPKPKHCGPNPRGFDCSIQAPYPPCTPIEAPYPCFSDCQKECCQPVRSECNEQTRIFRKQLALGLLNMSKRKGNNKKNRKCYSSTTIPSTVPLIVRKRAISYVPRRKYSHVTSRWKVGGHGKVEIGMHGKRNMSKKAKDNEVKSNKANRQQDKEREHYSPNAYQERIPCDTAAGLTPTQSVLETVKRFFCISQNSTPVLASNDLLDGTSTWPQYFRAFSSTEKAPTTVAPSMPSIRVSTDLQHNENPGPLSKRNEKPPRHNRSYTTRQRTLRTYATRSGPVLTLRKGSDQGLLNQKLRENLQANVRFYADDEKDLPHNVKKECPRLQPDVKNQCKLPKPPTCGPNPRGFDCSIRAPYPPCVAQQAPYPSFSECQKECCKKPRTECIEQERLHEIRKRTGQMDICNMQKQPPKDFSFKKGSDCKYSTLAARREFSSVSRNNSGPLSVVSEEVAITNDENQLVLSSQAKNSMSSLHCSNERLRRAAQYLLCIDLEKLSDQDFSNLFLDGTKSSVVSPWKKDTMGDGPKLSFLADAVKRFYNALLNMPELSLMTKQASGKINTSQSDLILPPCNKTTAYPTLTFARAYTTLPQPRLYSTPKDKCPKEKKKGPCDKLPQQPCCCPKARENCDTMIPHSQCSPVEAPYKSFSDCNRGFPKIPVCECLEQERYFTRLKNAGAYNLSRKPDCEPVKTDCGDKVGDCKKKYSTCADVIVVNADLNAATCGNTNVEGCKSESYVSEITARIADVSTVGRSLLSRCLQKTGLFGKIPQINLLYIPSRNYSGDQGGNNMSDNYANKDDCKIKKDEGIKGKCTLPKLPPQPCCDPKFRDTCVVEQVHPQCSPIAAPYDSFSDCHRPFAAIPTCECSEQEKVMTRLQKSGGYEIKNLQRMKKHSCVTPPEPQGPQKRKFSSCPKNGDVHPMFQQEVTDESMTEVEEKELAKKVLTTVKNGMEAIAVSANDVEAQEAYFQLYEELEKLCEQELHRCMQVGDSLNKRRPICSRDIFSDTCLNKNTVPSMADKNLKQMMTIDAIKSFCTSMFAIPTMSTTLYEESERHKTEKLQKQLDELLDKYKAQ